MYRYPWTADKGKGVGKLHLVDDTMSCINPACFQCPSRFPSDIALSSVPGAQQRVEGQGESKNQVVLLRTRSFGKSYARS